MNPQRKQNLSEGVRNLWKTPGHREKAIAGMKAAYARRKKKLTE